MNGFNNYVFNKRIEEIHLKTVKANHDYIKLSIYQKQLYQQIQLLLPENKRHILIKFDDCASNQSAIIEKIMYESGIKDCINFLIST